MAWGCVTQDQLLRHALPMELVVHGCGLGSAVAFPAPNALPLFRTYGNEMVMCVWFSSDSCSLYSWIFDGETYRVQRQPRQLDKGPVEVLHKTKNWMEGLEECKKWSKRD